MILYILQVKELVQHTELTLGPVDILVNNAGTMYYTMMKNLHEDEWERQIDVNIKVNINIICNAFTLLIRVASSGCSPFLTSFVY